METQLLAMNLNSYIGKVIGSNRPLAVDWKLQVPYPPRKAHVQLTEDYLLKYHHR